MERFHPRHHFLERGRIRAVAMEDLVAERETALGHYQADHDLRAVRTVVTRIAAHRGRIVLGQSFEVRARQVVEQNVKGLLEERADARLEVSFERALVRQKLIQGAVEAVLVYLFTGGPGHVREGGAGVKTFLDRQLPPGRE